MARIAARHGLRLSELLALNPQIKNPDRIYPGQVITIGLSSSEAEESEEKQERI